MLEGRPIDVEAKQGAKSDRAAPLIRIAGVTKSYGPMDANKDISLSVGWGESVGLIGGNGAGKSTLTRILCGIVTPDAGNLEISGEALPFGEYTARKSHDVGIRFIHQELSLCANLTVAENFLLEDPHIGGFEWGWRRRYADLARKSIEDIFPNSGIDVDQIVGDMPIGQRQMVEIARAASDPKLKLLILDEPTSSLSSQRSAELRTYVLRRAKHGMAFIFISHKLREILDLVDRIVVLRNGRLVRDGGNADQTVESLVEAMGGDMKGVKDSSLPAAIGPSKRDPAERRVLVRLHDRNAQEGAGLVLRAGDIVGLAGLEGNGQREFLHSMILPGVQGGSLKGEPQGTISFVSGDRHREGVMPLWSVFENILIGPVARRATFGLIPAAAAREAVSPWLGRLELDAARLKSPILELSGGNQQKALVARALATQSEIVLLDDPTKGVDVGAKHAFYRTLKALAAEGRLVIWHTTEDLEFLQCDRVLVMDRGALAGSLSGEEISEDAIVKRVFQTEIDRRAAQKGEPSQSVGFSRANLSSLALRGVSVASFLVAAIIVTSINPDVLTPFGIELTLESAVVLVLISLAQIFLIGGSQIDLGVGAFASLSSVIAAQWLADQPIKGAAALLVAFLVYCGMGLLVQARRLPSIVVTLGAAFIWSGAGYTLQPAPGGKSPEWLTAISNFSPWGVPNPVVVITLAGLIAFLVNRSRHGVVLRGFGANPAALTQKGWSAPSYAVYRYLIAALFGIAAGLALTAINNGSDNNAGNTYTLLSVAAALIGGCALIGGTIRPIGTVFGAVTLSLVAQLLSALNVSTDYTPLIQGGILMLILMLQGLIAHERANP